MKEIEQRVYLKVIVWLVTIGLVLISIGVGMILATLEADQDYIAFWTLWVLICLFLFASATILLFKTLVDIAGLL
jgi:hypothetical protein